MEDEAVSVLLCEVQSSLEQLRWPEDLFSELQTYVSERVRKYKFADNASFDNLRELDYWEHFYGQLSACIRCGEIARHQRYQLLTMGICHKCGSNGLRANLEDERHLWITDYYVIGKGVVKMGGMRAVIAEEEVENLDWSKMKKKVSFNAHFGCRSGRWIHDNVELPELEHPEWLLVSSDELYRDQVFWSAAPSLVAMVWRKEITVYLAKALLLMLSPRPILLVKFEKLVYLPTLNGCIRI